jgi:hypothetical protein
VKTKRSYLLEAASVAVLFAAAGLLGGCDTDSDLENAAEEVDENIDDAADELDDAVDDIDDDLDDGI